MGVSRAQLSTHSVGFAFFSAALEEPPLLRFDWWSMLVAAFQVRFPRSAIALVVHHLTYFNKAAATSTAASLRANTKIATWLPKKETHKLRAYFLMSSCAPQIAMVRSHLARSERPRFSLCQQQPPPKPPSSSVALTISSVRVHD